MSDELERRLREAGHRLPGPAPDDTLDTRVRFLAAATPVRRLSLRRRSPVFALAAAVVLAGAFGVGYAVAAGKTQTKTVTKTQTRVVKERLNAGPGFLPADGWAIDVALDPQTGAIVAANASRNGTELAATFAPASTRQGLPQRTLPLQLPAGGKTRHLAATVGAYAVEVDVRLPATDAATLAAAREELGRLVVPACPSAHPLTAADVDAAKRYVLAWLPAHYQGDPSETAGATATAAAGATMPRHDEAAADCGADVAGKSVEVDVTLPKLAAVSASLSQLTFFVAKTRDGWEVWERAR
ncbi:MAG TPA: hypothetical protein VFJ77_09960 [Gaiellaceae bacterium]|nr:hypothetical protein [Gaiellaceae bacterium]